MTASVMLDGMCRRCLELFEGSGPNCWCAYCHGDWTPTGRLGVAVFIAIRNDNSGAQTAARTTAREPVGIGRSVKMPNWARWRYRRMAWKNDPYLFMRMHPHLAWVVDRLYEPSWPLREWLFYSMPTAAREQEKVKAIRAVYQYGPKAEVDTDNYDGNATDIYAAAWDRGER